MIENDIRRLDERALDRSLDEPESDIWLGVAARTRQRRAARRVASIQGVVLTLALLGSVAAGVRVARPGGASSTHAARATGSELMPSSLLLGDRP